MRGNESEPHNSNKRSDSFLRWLSGDRLPTNNQQREYHALNNFYSHGGSSRAYKYHLTRQEFAYRATVALTSAATFGIGIGQCLTKLIG